jgi:hypothetical protein
MSSAPSVWILAAGVFDLALAFFHLFFWRLFGWPGSLQASGRVNRGVTQILNFAITYLFVLAALLCFFFPGELAATELGRFWLMAMAVFWLARALIHPSSSARVIRSQLHCSPCSSLVPCFLVAMIVVLMLSKPF